MKKQIAKTIYWTGVGLAGIGFGALVICVIAICYVILAERFVWKEFAQVVGYALIVIALFALWKWAAANKD